MTGPVFLTIFPLFTLKSGSGNVVQCFSRKQTLKDKREKMAKERANIEKKKLHHNGKELGQKKQKDLHH